jgi:hypothetical protein
MGAKRRGKNKKPKSIIKISPEKKARGGSILEKERIEGKKLSWKFSIIDTGGEWTFKNIKKDYFWDHLLNKLKNYESQTVGEFIVPEHNHKIEKCRLCKEAQKRLIEIELDDCDELYSVHITNIKRLWGILEGSYFKILWWDPHHEICPSNKH